MSFDDFPDLYILTSATSRKVAQIQEHPIVYWMFSNHDLSFIVNLTGRAEIYLHEAEAMKRIWQQIADKSSAFRVCTSWRTQLPVLSNPSMICGLDPRIGLEETNYTTRLSHYRVYRGPQNAWFRCHGVRKARRSRVFPLSPERRPTRVY